MVFQWAVRVCQRLQSRSLQSGAFQTLLLPHRFIKNRPSHQRPVSIESLTICRIPGFPKSEQNRKSCGNVRIWRKGAAVRRKNHSNLSKSFGVNLLECTQRISADFNTIFPFKFSACYYMAFPFKLLFRKELFKCLWEILLDKRLQWGG